MKIIAILISLLFTSPAWALICSGVPYTFVDGPGNIIYSAQVNANFTTVVNCINTGVATNGVNTNITTLTGLTSPPAGSGSLSFFGISVTGTNAIVVAGTTPTGFTYTAGERITFVAAGANTGATTLQVSGGATANLYKPVNGAVQAFSGGEIAAGQIVDAVYDGTQFELVSNATNTGVPSGAVEAFYLSSCPSGWLPANGSSGTINMVGYFIRGLDTGGVVDPTARTLGSVEGHMFQDHTHTTISTSLLAAGIGTLAYPTGSTNTGTASSGNHGSETRPVNVALLYCQKQ